VFDILWNWEVKIELVAKVKSPMFFVKLVPILYTKGTKVHANMHEKQFLHLTAHCDVSLD